MAKYFATSLAMEGGQTAPSHEQLLADAHNVDQLGGRGIQVHHVARFLGGLGARVHGHRHIRLGKSRRIVGAVSGHGDHMALGLQVADHLQLALRRRFGEKVVHSRFRRDGGRGQRVVAGDHDGLDPHFPQIGELLFHAVLDDILQMDDPNDFMVLRHHQGRAPLVGDGLDCVVAFGAVSAAVLSHIPLHGIGRPLADLAAVKIHAAHAGGRGEGDKGHALVLQASLADTEPLLRQHHDAAALRRFIREGGKLRGVGQLFRRGAVHRDEIAGLPVTQGNGAGLIQHQDIHVAGGLDGAAAHGQHVCLVQPAHARDADGGEQGADGGGRQADQQRHQGGDGGGIRYARLIGREYGIGVQGNRHQDEDDGKGHQKNLQSDFVGGLFTGRPLHHGDHFI